VKYGMYRAGNMEVECAGKKLIWNVECAGK
jgi:hypothetical protein